MCNHLLNKLKQEREELQVLQEELEECGDLEERIENLFKINKLDEQINALSH